MLNVPENAYEGRIGNFRQFVLDKPINEINRNTRYFITYETIKKGRSVSGFKFFCNCNKITEDDEYTETIENPQSTEIQASLAVPEEHTEDEKTYIKLVHYGFSQKNVQAMLEVCGGDISELASRLEYGEERAKQDKEKGKKIASISGYLRRAIEENWLQAKKDEERAKEKELEAAKTGADWEIWAKKKFANEPVPDVPEEKFGEDGMGKVIVNMIRADIKSRKLGSTSKRLLAENGMTVSRFIELYM